MKQTARPTGQAGAKLGLIGAMFAFGTIGIFVRSIPLPSSVIALVRGFLGTGFLLLVTVLRRRTLDWSAIKAHGLGLVLSGAAIGANWIFLFEAYRYTTVSTATLCYYLAPVFVILASPLVLRETLTPRRLLCAGVALTGMVLVSGVLDREGIGAGELTGIALGIGAAVLYASVVLMNKRIQGVTAYDRTIVQLAVAAVVLLPYTLLTEPVAALHCTPLGLVLLAVVGIVHTGIAYALYFGAVSVIPAQTAAILSYIDPIVAIVLSAVLLHEHMGLLEVLGAGLILASTLYSELKK